MHDRKSNVCMETPILLRTCLICPTDYCSCMIQLPTLQLVMDLRSVIYGRLIPTFVQAQNINIFSRKPKDHTSRDLSGMLVHQGIMRTVTGWSIEQASAKPSLHSL